MGAFESGQQQQADVALADGTERARQRPDGPLHPSDAMWMATVGQNGQRFANPPRCDAEPVHAFQIAFPCILPQAIDPLQTFEPEGVTEVLYGHGRIATEDYDVVGRVCWCDYSARPAVEKLIDTRMSTPLQSFRY